MFAFMSYYHTTVPGKGEGERSQKYIAPPHTFCAYPKTGTRLPVDAVVFKFFYQLWPIITT